MNINTLSRYNRRDVLLFLCTGFLAWTIGSHLGKVNTLGSIFRELFIPSLPFIFLIVVIAITDFSNFRINNLFSLFKLRINFRFHHLIIFLSIGIILGIVAAQYVYLGLMYIPLFLFVIVSFFAAIILSFKNRPLYGLLIFFACAPIIVFLERDFDVYYNYLGGEGDYLWGLIGVTPMFIFIFTLLLVHISIKLSKKIKFENSPLTKLIIAFISVIILTTLIASNDLLVSFRSIISQIFIPLIFFFITINCVKNREDIAKTLLFILMCTVFICFISFYFYGWFGEVSVAEARAEIASQQHGSQLTYAVSLIMGFPICLTFIEIAKKKFIRLGAIFGAVFLSVFAIIIQFLTAILSIIAGSILLVKNSSYKKVYTAILVVLLIMAILVPSLSAVLTARFENISIKSLPNYVVYSLWHTRFLGLQGAMRMVQDYPLCGVGFGMEHKYNHIYSNSFIYPIFDGLGRRVGETVTYMSSHQLYLGYATQSGFLGLSALLYLLLSIVIISIKNVRHSLGKHDKIINLCIFGVIIVYLTISLFSDAGFALGVNFITGGVFWTVVGLVCVMRRLQLQEQSSVSV